MSLPVNGSTDAETCATLLSLVIAATIAACWVGSVILPVPFVVANTMVVWPPLKAGSFAFSTFEAFCASVPGMVKLSFVLPPLAWAIAIAAIAASSQSASTMRRRR